MNSLLLIAITILLTGCTNEPTPEDKKTIDTLTTVCNGGYAHASNKDRGEACTYLGSIYLGVDNFDYLQDEKESYKYYKRGCGLNNAKSCYMVGIQYEEGYGVQLNFDIAKKKYKKSCKLGLKKGCKQYALLNDPEYWQAKLDSIQSQQSYYSPSQDTQKENHDSGYLSSTKSYDSDTSYSSIYNSDGSYSRRTGDTIHNSDGSYSRVSGSTLYNSDGTYSRRTGDTIHNSDGSYSRIGY